MNIKNLCFNFRPHFVFFITILIFNVKLFAYNEALIKELVEKENYVSVIEKLKNIEIKQENWKLGYYLGVAYFKTGNYLSAKKIFEETLDIEQDLANLYFNLAMVELKLKNFLFAIKYLKEALRLDVSLEPKCQYYIIFSYIKLDDRKKALEVFGSLLKKWYYSEYFEKSKNLLLSYNIEYSEVYKQLILEPKKNFSVDLEFSGGFDSNLSFSSEENTNEKLQDYLSVVNLSFSYMLNNILINSLISNKYFFNKTSYNFNIYSASIKYDFLRIYNSIFSTEIEIDFLNYYTQSNYSFWAGLVSNHNLFGLNLGFKLDYRFSNYLDDLYNYLNNSEISSLMKVGCSDKKQNIAVSFAYSDKSAGIKEDFLFNYSYFVSTGATLYSVDVYTPEKTVYSYKSFVSKLSFQYFVNNSFNFICSVDYQLKRYKDYNKYYNVPEKEFLYVTDVGWFYWDSLTNNWIATESPILKEFSKVREDNLIDFGLRLNFKITNNYIFFISYDFSDDISNLEEYNYKKHSFFAGLNLSFGNIF